MIQIRIEVVEHKTGRISIESQIAIENQTATVVEVGVILKLKDLIEGVLVELSKKMPNSNLATSEEDVETLRGLEDLNF